MSAALKQQQTAPAPASEATYIETVAPSVTPKKDEHGETRFQRLRDTLFHKSATNQQKRASAADQPLKHIGGEIVECPGMKVGFNPSDPSSMNCCATHFKNAVRKMNEFHDTPKPAKDKMDIIGNIKDAIMGPKPTAVVQHEYNADGSKFRISNEDQLLWRRLHLGAKELDYVIAASMRADHFNKRRSARLHAQNKRWKMRVDAQNKKAREALRSLNAIMNTKHDAATKRHKAILDDRVRELAAHDKVRARKGKKALADRKRADKHAEAKA